MALVDFPAMVSAVLLFYGLPLTSTLPFGLLYGAWPSEVSMRKSLRWALAFGLAGLAISNALIWFYRYWQYNLRGNVFFAKAPHFLDPFMIQARPVFDLCPVLVAVIVTLVTICVLDLHWRRRTYSDA